MGRNFIIYSSILYPKKIINLVYCTLQKIIYLTVLNKGIERAHQLGTNDKYVMRLRCRNLVENKIIMEGIYHNKSCAQGKVEQGLICQSLQAHHFTWATMKEKWHRAIKRSMQRWLIGLVDRVFTNGSGDLGSIPGCVIPKTLKMVLDTSLLNTQQYKVHIEGKVEQSRERSSTLPYISV